MVGDSVPSDFLPFDELPSVFGFADLSLLSFWFDVIFVIFISISFVFPSLSTKCTVSVLFVEYVLLFCYADFVVAGRK